MARPKKFTSAKQVEGIINDYLKECESKEEFPTISGLAYALDMSTESLRRYGKEEKFCATVRKGKQIVERAWEQKLLAGGSGAIFWLKNNAGWKDKTEQEVKNQTTIILSPEDEDL